MGSENTVGKMLTNGGGLKIPLKTFFAMNSELEIFFNEISTQNFFLQSFCNEISTGIVFQFFCNKINTEIFFRIIFLTKIFFLVRILRGF